MATEKNSMLYHAANMLNRPDIPWVVTVEGDSIVARWKWMDAVFFAPHEITEEVRSYTFTVTLIGEGKFKEHDSTEDTSKGISMSGGTIGVGASSNKFSGKKSQKSFQMGIGKDNESGKFGIISFKYDTTQVKNQIRSYMEANGWKKAGLFG